MWIESRTDKRATCSDLGTYALKVFMERATEIPFIS